MKSNENDENIGNGWKWMGVLKITKIYEKVGKCKIWNFINFSL